MCISNYETIKFCSTFTWENNPQMGTKIVDRERKMIIIQDSTELVCKEILFVCVCCDLPYVCFCRLLLWVAQKIVARAKHENEHEIKNVIYRLIIVHAQTEPQTTQGK